MDWPGDHESLYVYTSAERGSVSRGELSERVYGNFGFLPSQPCPPPTTLPLQRPYNPSITHLWLLRSLYLKHPLATSQIRHRAWARKHFSQRSWQRASQWPLARVFFFALIVPYSNHTYVSPTDNLVTPVTQKLNAAKKKHFTKSVSQVSQINIDLIFA